MSHQVKNFANLIVAAYAQTPFAEEKAMLEPVAKTLPQAKRISYDRSFVELVDRTRSVDIEEILPHLSRTKLPFHRLWIEGPAPDGQKASDKISHRPIVGMLVESKPGSDSFSFRTFAKQDLDKGEEDYWSSHGYRIKKQVLNDSVIVEPFGIAAIVSATSGITLDEKLIDVLVEDRKARIRTLDLLSTIEKEKTYTQKSIAKIDNTAVIDDCYRTADFLARTFVLLGSEFAGKGAQLTKDSIDLGALEHDKKRIKKDRVPLVPVRPIVIDLGKVPQKFFHSNDPKETHQLLGWTSVRRTHVVNKHGTEFWRKPHDRRIPSEVDRRDVVRVLTNSNEALRLELQGGAPTRVIERAESSLKKFSV